MGEVFHSNGIRMSLGMVFKGMVDTFERLFDMFSEAKLGKYLPVGIWEMSKQVLLECFPRAGGANRLGRNKFDEVGSGSWSPSNNWSWDNN